MSRWSKINTNYSALQYFSSKFIHHENVIKRSKQLIKSEIALPSAINKPAAQIVKSALPVEALLLGRLIIQALAVSGRSSAGLSLDQRFWRVARSFSSTGIRRASSSRVAAAAPRRRPPGRPKTATPDPVRRSLPTIFRILVRCCFDFFFSFLATEDRHEHVLGRDCGRVQWTLNSLYVGLTDSFLR